ncbi:hypothetical protein N7532_006902 [Penicillium argentinense]|uniref:Uncharacterized protein n=1 Tax=Penicillium argentinense TaxID=1131581 RepID=A0A9W9KBQ3_9EURO|nr:uncharacterized protein N7532_006902 [Penicillium argentinense]KAJ5099901.1 hypothetical protein N7532_006902 [Penicillium argentinense]
MGAPAAGPAMAAEPVAYRSSLNIVGWGLHGMIGGNVQHEASRPLGAGSAKGMPYEDLAAVWNVLSSAEDTPDEHPSSSMTMTLHRPRSTSMRVHERQRARGQPTDLLTRQIAPTSSGTRRVLLQYPLYTTHWIHYCWAGRQAGSEIFSKDSRSRALIPGLRDSAGSQDMNSPSVTMQQARTAFSRVLPVWLMLRSAPAQCHAIDPHSGRPGAAAEPT